MERESSIEKITAEVVESLVVSVCRKGDCFFTLCSPADEPQEKQMTSIPATSKTIDSSAFFKNKLVKLNRKTSWKNIESDVMQNDSLSLDHSTDLCPLIQILPGYEIDLQKHNNQPIKSSKHFSESCDPFDACSLMIKSLLDSFDTDFNKQDDDVHTFNQQGVQGKVSNFTESSQPRAATIHHSETGMPNRTSLPAGNTGYCLDTKVIKAQSFICGNVFGHTNSKSSENLDLEIDSMVKEIISNNDELLSCCQTKNSKSEIQPTIPISHLTNKSWKPCDSSTSECSNNFIEFQLPSNELTSKLQTAANDDAENIIPFGWLNTQRKRKQRSSRPTFSRARSRSEDFVYCGPLRESICNDNGR